MFNFESIGGTRRLIKLFLLKKLNEIIPSIF